MANAKIDENFIHTTLAVDDNDIVRPIVVEPILDYLEIDIAIIPTHVDASLTIKEDDNYEGVSCAYDSGAALAKPLKVEASTGRLLIDLTL